MSAIPARRRRRMIAAVCTSVAAVVCLPTGIVIGANSLLNESGGNNVENTTTTEIPETPVELLAVTKTDGKTIDVSSAALIALAPGGKGGTIISIPIGASADVAKDEAPRRIGDNFKVDGIFGLKKEVENLFNITVNSVDDVTAMEFGDILSTAFASPEINKLNPTFDVNLKAPVVDTTAVGKDVTVLEAGQQTVSAQQIALALAAQQPSIPEEQRLPQTKELWSALAKAGVTPASTDSSVASAVPPARTDAPADTRGYFSGLLAGRVDVWQFGVTQITDSARNPNNSDMYELDDAEVLTVMASVIPSALVIVSSNITVMIDVPYSSTTYAREAVTRLAYVGANVVLVRQTSDAPTDRTVVYYNDELAKAEAESFVALIGPLEYESTTDVVSGVNLRIVLGNDFVSYLSKGSPTASSTTSSTVAK